MLYGCGRSESKKLSGSFQDKPSVLYYASLIHERILRIRIVLRNDFS